MLDFFKKFTKPRPNDESMLGSKVQKQKRGSDNPDDSIEFRFTDNLQNQTDQIEKAKQSLDLQIKFSVYNGATSQSQTNSGNSLIAFESPEYKIRLFGILNPHGLSGKEISSVLVAFIQNYMTESVKRLDRMNSHDEIEEFIEIMVDNSDKELNKNGIDLNFSGTTLTLILIIKTVIYSGSLGNTKAVLFREITNEKKFAIELTVDHTPENRDERYRIFQNGGVVKKVKVAEEEIGPFRIWEGKIDNGPGLQITRSLGDSKARKIGVISVPEVQHFELKVWDKFVVIATENVWSMLPSTRMCYHISKFLAEKEKDFQYISKFLAKKVQQRWKYMQENGLVHPKIDPNSFDIYDIAILVFTLNP